LKLNRILKYFLFGIFLLSLISCADIKEKNEFIKGIKLYNITEPLPSLFAKINDLEINTLFVTPAVDAEPGFRQACEATDIDRFLIVPIFYDPDAIAADPSLSAVKADGNPAKDDWVEFTCPTRIELLDKKIDYIVDLIKNSHPDGISLDFIRYFVFWEQVFPDTDPESLPQTCFCAQCLQKFQHDVGITIPEDLKETSQISQWIFTNHKQTWLTWRCNQIINAVSRISKSIKAADSDILINIHIIPWLQNDFKQAIMRIAAQNISEIGKYVDYLSPMCYHHMVKQNSSWIHKIATEIQQISGKPVLPSIQVSRAYLNTKLESKEFYSALGNAGRAPSSGIILWNWKSLEADKIKFGLAKKLFSNLKTNR